MATVSMMVLMTLVAIAMLSLSTIEQRSSGGGANEADRMARANARMALMMALGELQKAAGPDQRVTTTASILGDASNAYASGTTAVNGKKHWVGVWDTSKVERDVNGDGVVNDDDKTVDTNGDGEGDEFPPYSPADPDKKGFVRWLVSGNTNNPGDNLDSLTAVGIAPGNDDLVIFKGLNGAGDIDDEGLWPESVKVPKVEVATATPGNSSYYAYWVEDEGVKADLAWNEMPAPNPSDTQYPLGEADPQYIADMARWQASRLSNTAGPDYAAFDYLIKISEGIVENRSPFIEDSEDDIEPENYEVTYPLLGFPTSDVNGDGEITDADNQNPWIAEMKKAMSVADIPLVMNDDDNHSDWLKANRHNMAMNVRGVIADMKEGGLRRDLSLAFEMDGTAESENAGLFNQQTTEFVGNGDTFSSPHLMPGTSLYARHLFRDYGPKSDGTPSAGNAFSDHITLRPPTSYSDPGNNNAWVIVNPSPHTSQERTVVRGPSWWLMRDYANLYKRLKTPSSGSSHALSARAYFPNRSVAEDLVDMHGWNWGAGFTPVNRETDNANVRYAYRPVRASYAPVLLAVNALLSLVYEGGQLKLVVDPFFIVWNPYNTHITADKFAITSKEGFLGGVRFTHHLPAADPKYYGLATGIGSATTFASYAQQSAILSGGSAGINMSYLIDDLTMRPGEVMIFSPPNGADRSGNANVRNDELKLGMNYNATDSGIFFDLFPDATGGNWAPVNVPASESASHSIDAVFNLHGSAWVNKKFMMETSLPVPGTPPNALTTEAAFGDNLSGWEYRTSTGGGRPQPNLNKGSSTPVSFTFSELSSTKTSFGIVSMLNLPTDYIGINSGTQAQVEVFSQMNVTPVIRGLVERFKRHPFNVFTTGPSANGINNLMNKVGIDIDAFGDGSNGFYGKNYGLADGDTHFPLLDIPRAPLHSLVQLSGANIGIRLFEPTNAIGNSWKPPYIPMDSIYLNSATFWNSSDILTMNDVSWQVNDALFDHYYLSGIAPEYTIGTSGYDATGGSLNKTLKRFYGIDPDDPTQTIDPATAQANPALEPHVPSGKTSHDIVTELTPTSTNHEGYQKIAAYSLIKGAFNVNSTSVQAWRAFLQGNKALALESAQGTNDTGTGTPFPLASTTSNTSSNNGWEKFSRLTDDQIWDDNDTPSDLTDDTGLAVEIVNQVKARGPFMSISDFVNRRIAKDADLTAVPNVEDTDPRAYQGAIQEAIEQAGINGDQSTGIRASTSDVIPNYDNFSYYWRYQVHRTWYGRHEDFPYADDDNDPNNWNSNIGNRNCATGVPTEINQANILLPLAPRLSARSDTFKIRAYGEVRDADDNIIATATCEAVVQRLPEYVDTETDENNNEPWDEGSSLNTTNQTYGRRFEIRSFRWLDQSEV